MLWMLLIACAPALDGLEGHTLADDGHGPPLPSGPAWLADVRALPYDDLAGRIDVVQVFR